VTTPPALVEAEKPTGPRSRKGTLTRARLLEAAKEIFEEDGFLEARISDIAERAGLSHGSFYHYFESKEEIFRQIAESVDDQLSAPMDTVIFDTSSAATPHERIREALRRHVESYRQEAQIIGVIEEVSRYDEHVGTLRMERHQRYQQQVATSIRQLQQHGLADPDLDPKVTAAILGAMTNRFLEMWLVEGFLNCGFNKAVDQMSRVLINALGLKPEPAKPRRRPGSD
jgi:AcrR family transcriptional regulator